MMLRRIWTSRRRRRRAAEESRLFAEFVIANYGNPREK